jgi:hypothetical protein
MVERCPTIAVILAYREPGKSMRKHAGQTDAIEVIQAQSTIQDIMFPMDYFENSIFETLSSEIRLTLGIAYWKK